jgi:hypothetical protein
MVRVWGRAWVAKTVRGGDWGVRFATRLGIAPLTREVVEAERLENTVRREKTIEGVARAKAEKTAHLGLRKPALLIFFKRKRFERTT